MAFYLESQYLDLKKSYQNFSYESLIKNNESKQPILQEKQSNPHEGLSQNTYLFVQEKEILQEDINNLCIYFQHLFINSSSDIPEAKLKKFPFVMIKDRICYIIQKYQEQPTLLDTLMEGMIVPIMTQIREYIKILMINFMKNKDLETDVCQQFHDLISIVYILCKVRNQKYINKFFPHEVGDLEPVVFYLIRYRDKQLPIWETKYVLLLWISIIVLVPFDLITIDSKNIKMESFQFDYKQKGQFSDDIVTNLIELGKHYLRSSSKTREASAVFLSNFFTRTDIQKLNVQRCYIEWSIKVIEEIKNESLHAQFLGGVFLSLIEIFKLGQRNELQMHIDNIIQQLIQKGKNENTCIRHLKVKLAQRLGLVYLKPRVVKWAYSRGNKSLVENVNKTITTTMKSNVERIVEKQTLLNKQNADQPVVDETDYFEDVNLEQLENLIDFLIENLRDKDTVVRWSAAKGIGRITGRLDLDMADDVVSAILSLFSPNESEATWHGGCLTIAELSRRGLLLTSRLYEVFPIILKALLFDLDQGNYSLGANVRDSACYIAWAFARAYEPEVLLPYVTELSQNLVIASIFDREVNCRRAASAAFQEHVGRQGSFANGIQILTEADYFTLGLKNNAYLNVGPYVASFDVYFKSFIEYLAFNKLKHWELDTRKLSASALALMTCLNPKFLAEEILRGLINNCFDDNVNIRHGSIYGISEVLCGLAGCGQLHCFKDEMKDSIFLSVLSNNEKKLINAGEYMTKFKTDYENLRYINNINLIDDELLDLIIGVIDQLEQKKFLRGKGGEVMKIAVFRLIECISIAKLPLTQQHILKYTEIIEESLKSATEPIQVAASKAFAELSRIYHTELKKEYKIFVEKLIKSASTDSNTAVTRGYTKGLTSLNKLMVSHYLIDIIRICSENCKIKAKVLDDADTRKYTVQGICRIFQTVGLEDSIITQETFDSLFGLLFDVMNDYTMDNRGDIGSLIRQESMTAQLKILRIYAAGKKNNKNTVVLKEQTMQKIISMLLQQLAEKIDRIRLVAGSVLQEIFEKYIQYLPDFPHKNKFIQVFNKENIKKMVSKDQQRMDSTFETQVVEAELAYLVTQDIQQDNDDFIYYWNQPEGAFQIIVPLLDLEEYSLCLLKGISISIGGLTESVIKYSSLSMSEYLVSVNKHENRDKIYSQIFKNSITLLTENKKDERVIVPLYKTLDFILEKQEIQEWVKVEENKKYIKSMYELIMTEIHKTKQILKLTSVIGFIVTLTQLQYKEMQNDFFLLIGNLLCHVFPKVRKLMADKFYMMLIANGEDLFGELKSDEMIEFVTSNDWLDESINLGSVKQTFYKLLQVQEKKDVAEDKSKQQQKEIKKVVQIQIDDDEI